MYTNFSLRINSQSDPVYARIEAIRIRTALPAVPAPVASAPPRLATLLAPEIARGLLEVQDEATRSVVLIRGDSLFSPGSAEVSPGVVPLLDRVGDALKALPGAVLVTGHTDSQPIRTLRFPSNWHLSKARAQTVSELLAARIPGRVTAEGRADTEPVAPNDTPSNRTRNRRVEIELQLSAGSS
jgi:type VI secretion system protein ImpK